MSAQPQQHPSSTVLGTALSLIDAGISVLPISGTEKRPAMKWKHLQSERMNESQAREWFGGSTARYGLGVVCGAVSGGLELTEVEGRAVDRLADVGAAMESAGHGELWATLGSGWVESSPSGGVHWLYRVRGVVPGNDKIASNMAREVLAETRGEGGYVVVAPTPGRFHATGNPWASLGGDHTRLTAITHEQRAAFHAVLRRVLHESPTAQAAPTAAAPRPRAAPDGILSPGDDFEQRTDWADILEPHGWTLHHRDPDGTRYWTRPGKSEGSSATTGHADDRDRLFVFTTSTDFEQKKPYTKFGALAVLEHGGDHSKAATELRRRGYGGAAALAPVVQLNAPQAPDAAGSARGQDEQPSEDRSILRLRRMTDLKVPPVTTWIGPGWLPRGEITVLVGEEGLGKSLAWVRIAAAITTGRADPVFNIPDREPADVVLILTEDSTREVLERLRVAGADPSRVYVFSTDDDGSGSPVFGRNANDGNFLALGAYLAQEGLNPALVVVDAWLDTVDGNLHIKDTQQARQALHPWKVTAARHDLAVMLLTHTNRVDTGSTRDKMGGTAALRQKARMVLHAARPLEDGDTRNRMVIGPEKTNLAGTGNAVVFAVAVEQVRPRTDEDPGTTAVLSSPQDVGAPIRELVAQWHRDEQEARRTPTKTEACEAAIREFLAGKESVPVPELNAHLEAADFRKTVIEKAKKAVGHSARTSMGGPWLYRLGPNPLASPHLPVLPVLPVLPGHGDEQEKRGGPLFFDPPAVLPAPSPSQEEQGEQGKQGDGTDPDIGPARTFCAAGMCATTPLPGNDYCARHQHL